MASVRRFSPITSNAPSVDEAMQQQALAQALQQRAMMPNMPRGGGPVEAQYGPGNALIDLANSLAAAWNTKRAGNKLESAKNQQSEMQAQAIKDYQRSGSPSASLENLRSAPDGQLPEPVPTRDEATANMSKAFGPGVQQQLAMALMQKDLGLDATSAPSNVRSYEYGEKLRKDDPEAYKRFVDSLRSQNIPAAIQEANLAGTNPEFLTNTQKVAAAKVGAPYAAAEQGGGKGVLDRTSGKYTPQTTLATETNAATQLASGKKIGEMTGTAEGAIAKRAIDADNVTALLDLADPLLDVSTGSSLGAATDKVAAFFGGAPDGAKAAGQLKVLSATLIQNMPRLEGPQSDRDTLLYREASAQLGDETVPVEIRKAALKTVRDIQSKYKEAFAGRASQSKAQTNTNAKGWVLHTDASGNKAYVSPDGTQFEEAP